MGCNGLCLSADGSNVAEVTVSKQSELTVPSDGDQCRDYTRASSSVLATPVVPCLASTTEGTSSPSATLPSWQLAGSLQSQPSLMPTQRNSRVLMVHIRDLRCPNVTPLGGLTIPLVSSAFGHFGAVEKVVMGPDQAPTPLAQVDAFIQFAIAESARQAMRAAQGQSLTGDSFHKMDVEMSSWSELVVTTNDSSSWDYTVATPSGSAVAPMLVTQLAV